MKTCLIGKMRSITICEFDHVKCSLRKPESAELIIRIYLKTSSVIVKGVDMYGL